MGTYGSEKSLLNEIDILLDSHGGDLGYHIEDLARDLRISRVHLHRKVKNLTGMSCSEYIRKRKLARAYQLITNTRKTISEIAYEVGFNNLSYFARCFKRNYAQNPSELRNNAQPPDVT